MTLGAKIGIIGAAGWLGQAFTQAIVNAGLSAPLDLTLSYRSQRPAIVPGAMWTKDNQELVERSDIIIVSVRPQDFDNLVFQTSGKLVISVMAGITLERLSKRFNSDRIARTLPNAAAEVGKSYTPWVGSKNLLPSDRIAIQKILESCGTCDEVFKEADIDFFTGYSGTGPAFPALLAAAMVDSAVAHGLDREVAIRSVNAVLIGTGRLLELCPEDPHKTVQSFLDYRGVTAAAIETMRAANFDTAVRKGLAAALQKTKLMATE